MLADPNIALFVASLGLLGVYAELCRPGKVIPGVLGGIALLVGLASMVNAPAGTGISFAWAVGIATPVGAITIWLASVAMRARRNKRS